MDRLKFRNQDNKEMTITQYFKEAYNKTLKFGRLLFIMVGKKYYIPLEVCVILSGFF